MGNNDLSNYMTTHLSTNRIFIRINMSSARVERYNRKDALKNIVERFSKYKYIYIYGRKVRLNKTQTRCV